MREVGRPGPEEYQPALGWWGQAWRIALMALISAIVWFTPSSERDGIRLAIDLAAGVPAVVLVFLRRRWPTGVAVATTLLSTVSAVAAGPATLAAASLATGRRWPRILVVSVLSLAAASGFTQLNPPADSEPWWVTFASNVAFIAAMMAWGMYVGSRRELLWTLRARAERAEAEQDLRANQSRLEERSRIAREMHDVLAHRISQISMRAGALSFREDLDADQLRDGVGVIRDTAHQALTDLRGVLGVLREGERGPLRTPQPTYADLGELLEESRRSGQRIEYTDGVADTETPVPAATGRTLYRIVQEGITNARKHAPGCELSIEVRGSPDDGIGITLRNPLGFDRTTTPGSGLGLVGLVERATLRGGQVEHGTEDGEFVLRGWIPWAA